MRRYGLLLVTMASTWVIFSGLAGWLVQSLLAPSAKAQASGVPGTRLIPLGYCQLTSIDTVTVVNTGCPGGIPAGATAAYFVPEAQAIRYRDDTVAPTATVGMPVPVAAYVFYVGTLSNLQVISQTSGAKLNILFYK